MNHHLPPDAKLDAVAANIAQGVRDRRFCLVGPVFLQGGAWITQIATAPGSLHTLVWGRLDSREGCRLLRDALPIRNQLIGKLRPNFRHVLAIAQEAQFDAARQRHWPHANQASPDMPNIA